MILFNVGILVIALGWIPGLALKKAFSINKAGMASTVAGCALVLIASVRGMAGAFSGDLYFFSWRTPSARLFFSLGRFPVFFSSYIASLGAAAVLCAGLSAPLRRGAARSKAIGFFTKTTL